MEAGVDILPLTGEGHDESQRGPAADIGQQGVVAGYSPSPAGPCGGSDGCLYTPKKAVLWVPDAATLAEDLAPSQQASPMPADGQHAG